MKCNELFFSLHIIERMVERDIDKKALVDVLNNGETIEKYPNDKPFPSFLLLGFIGKTPIHLVVAKDPVNMFCVIITAYFPSELIWSNDFKTRRKK